MIKPVRLFAVIAPALALAATAAGAQTRHNSNAPIDFGADHIELQDKANRAILSGSVSVKQAEMTLNSARMTVAYTGQVIDGSPQVSRLDASGNVVVTRPDQSARGQYAIYDLNRRVITMLGAVTLVQAGNTVNGGRLTINLDTGRAVIDGSSVGGSRPGPDGSTTTTPGGRVTGRFSVPKRN
ncbi:LptA/OstA family protein [Sphingomonas alpina]|uniref:LPS export ABC transporter periplasmic protein LptC n=1 Tax=Sphingomonas alpina TaxID=653931 RepID=A0A7H0LHR1_9SPHN|nr:LptA/OstA family protein [Sphingomonas alpina]QNQ09214.1 LPS export ABC transporter periplasmic protein LptC [Sphingomonas alpina]